MLVLDSRDGNADVWRSHARDVRRDWAEAFEGPVPHISGIGIGADTDNKADKVDARFQDGGARRSAWGCRRRACVGDPSPGFDRGLVAARRHADRLGHEAARRRRPKRKAPCGPTACEAGHWLDQHRATRTNRGKIDLTQGAPVDFDACIAVTGAAAPSWPRVAGQATDSTGFIRVGRSLQTLRHPHILAAGGVAAYEDARPKPRLRGSRRAGAGTQSARVVWRRHAKAVVATATSALPDQHRGTAVRRRVGPADLA